MKNFWDKMAKSYDHSVNTRYSLTNQKIVEYTKRYCTKNDSLLELACGTGEFTVALSNSVKKIYAIDQSCEMIKIAKEKADSNHIRNINWDIADITLLDLPSEEYQIITAFNVLLYLPDDESFLQMVHHLLPKNGYFISVTDCFANKCNPLTIMQAVGTKLSLFPKIHKYSMKGLEQQIAAAGLKIRYSKNVYDKFPNYFIVAQKR